MFDENEIFVIVYFQVIEFCFDGLDGIFEWYCWEIVFYFVVKIEYCVVVCGKVFCCKVRCLFGF